MNAINFIDIYKYKEIKKKADLKEPFSYIKTIQSKKCRITVEISGRWHKSWDKDCDDEVYHTFMDFDYNGRNIGNGGCGGCFELSNYETIKEHIDFLLEKYANEVFDANKQLSLFG